MKALARSYVWWPGLDTDIVTKVQLCHHCQENRNSPAKAPLHPWEWPTQPWTRLHMDHAGPIHGKLFLILVDSHSKWMEVHIVPSTSAEATIKLSSRYFPHMVFPSRLLLIMVLDLRVESSKISWLRWEFSISVPPRTIPLPMGLQRGQYKPSSLLFSKLEGPMEHHLTQFLFRYRVTPQTTTGLSPAQLLMGRRLRSTMDLLHPDTSKEWKITEEADY